MALKRVPIASTCLHGMLLLLCLLCGVCWHCWLLLCVLWRARVASCETPNVWSVTGVANENEKGRGVEGLDAADTL